MKLTRSSGFGTMGRIGAAVLLTLAPMSGVQAQTVEPVRAGFTLLQTPPSVSPFIVRGSAPTDAWTMDNGGRLVWTAAEPMRTELRQASSQGHGQRARSRSKGYKGAQRVLAGVALGVLGFFGGGLTGAAIDSAAGASGDSPGLAGFVIGAPIGAAVGATIGFLIVD
jgi:hypothetical protein